MVNEPLAIFSVGAGVDDDYRGVRAGFGVVGVEELGDELAGDDEAGGIFVGVAEVVEEEGLGGLGVGVDAVEGLAGADGVGGAAEDEIDAEDEEQDHGEGEH